MVRSVESIGSEEKRKLTILEEMFSRRRQFKGWGAVISLYEVQVDDSNFAICGEMMTAFGDHFTLDAGKHPVFMARELIRRNTDSVLPPLDKFRLYSKRMSSCGIIRAVFLEIANQAADHVKRMPDSGGVCVPSFFMRIAEIGGTK
ncbi:hypothetical protein AC781_11505 [Akkermansia glycaniphila]|nr:hypothetical protein AC781_11505 [Akkermansia glycaniphila]